MNGSCPFMCSFKNSYGYCQVTACINPKHNGSGTWKTKYCKKCKRSMLIQKNENCPYCGGKVDWDDITTGTDA